MSSEVVQSFRIDERTKWTCGVCGDGRLSIVDNSLHQQRDAGSYANDDHPNWEPDWETGRFSCLFTCDECHDTVTVGGTYGYDERIVSDARGEPDYQLVPVYAPSSVEPGPRLLMRPKGLPSEIEGALALCERLFWVDASAACNAVRQGVEALMTHQGVKRTSVNKKTKKRTPIFLHSRIEFYKSKGGKLADELLAIKWIGNAGSHHGVAPTRADVLVSLEILEHVLIELFDKKSETLAKTTRAINRQKGLPKKQKK